MSDSPKRGVPAEWLLAGGTIFALATGLLLSEFGRFRQGELLTKEVTAARADADTALKSVIAPGVLVEAEKSVYLVYTEGGWGSAFVVDRERGILATAGHVAEALDPDNKKDPPFAANRFSKKPMRVYARRVHAGFHTMENVAEEYQPLDPMSSLYSPRPAPIFDSSADAGILFVDPIDPETGENILGPALPVASRETLLALKPGDPIAIVSYPYNMVTGNMARASASARSDRGTIANLVSSIDLAVDSDNPETLNLIVHRMSIGPGSSGSPLFNRNMEVIGITSYGVPSGDAAAQRADLVHDLLATLQEEVSVAKVYTPDWRARFERFVPAREGLPMSLYRTYTDEKRKPDEPEAKLGAVDLDGELPYESRIVEMTFPTATRNFVVEAPDLRLAAPSGVTASTPASPAPGGGGGGGVAAQARPVFVLNAEGRYIDGVVPLEANKEYAIFAFDYAVSITPGACPVAIYSRLQGQNVLTPAIGLPLTQVRVEKSDKARELEVVFMRPTFKRTESLAACNDASEKFIVGVVSWEDKKTPAPATPPPAAGPAPTAAHDAGDGVVLARLDLKAVRGDRLAKIRNFADCKLAFGDKSACIEPVKAEYRAP